MRKVLYLDIGNLSTRLFSTKKGQEDYCEAFARRFLNYIKD
jgi:hypothetical protein